MTVRVTTHDVTCQRCGAPIPAGTPQRFWLGPRPNCVECDERALENYGNYRRRCIEHNERRRRELEDRGL
ncbi:hypothetical protein G6023_10925 [Dietzia sp. DQ11-71]|uniref:hypothetical protein n=1 Tax=Dietzia maris TaxID=37915 RepID=UPI00104A12BF|nr:MULTISPECIES: hypothetical protein [Dietzia]MBB0997271.1 hypothetical protein [Dietzia maris]MBB1010008.1 hypothetical protein [Dietzia sp. SLG510A3-3B2-2]MBB1018788.1 hypothetical protein [Dietzia sp. DQ11-71]